MTQKSLYSFQNLYRDFLLCKIMQMASCSQYTKQFLPVVIIYDPFTGCICIFNAYFPRNSKKRSGFSSNLAPIPYNAFHLSASNFSFHGRIFSENSPSCSSNKNPFFVIRKRSRFCISTCFISYILCSPVCKLLPDRLFYIKQFYINGRSSSKKSKSSSSSSKSGKSKYFSRYSSYF